MRLEDVFSEIKKWFNGKVLKEEKVFEFLNNVGGGRLQRYLREILGHAGKFEDDLRLQIWDLLRGIALRGDKGLKVFLIENNPDRKLREIDQRFEGMLSECWSLKDALTSIFGLIPNSSLYIRSKDFRELYNKLLRAKQKREKGLEIECQSLQGNMNKKIKLEEMDMILVDIFLGEEENIDGIDFVNVLREVVPYIPTFILSVAGDYEIIQKAFSKGTDFYILKNQVFSVPVLYDAYIDDLGELIRHIKDSTLQKSLIGNIRYWKYKRNYLGFGDKCYHMIDHNFNHFSDDWEIANKILVPLLRENFLENRDYRDNLLYAFCMAIWLHDIGHKGTHRYGEPHLIRDTHGIISAEIILSLPESFGIKDKNANIYKGLLFPVGIEKKPVTQLILEQAEKKKTLSVSEMIALLSIYHKSNSPLREKEYYNMINEGKFIPLDFFENSEPGKPVIPLERILDKIGNHQFKEDFLILTALLRFIDGLDIKISRVGDPNEEEIKKWVIKQDLKYNFKRMEDLVKRMATKISQNPLNQTSFIKSFFLDVKEKIEKKESIPINELAQQLSQFEEWNEYRMLLNYCYFIGAQEGHFDLHSSVSKIEINYKSEGYFEISLFTEKEKSDLEKIQLYEVGRRMESVYERLIGESSCYVIKELRSGGEDLKKIINGINIQLRNLQTGEILGEKQWP